MAASGKSRTPQTAPRWQDDGILRFLTPAILFIVCALSLLQKTDLTLGDLGRHIKNGDVMVHGNAAERQALLHTNFYSYALRDYPFINHHWLSGVLFYGIWKVSGFEGLTVGYAFMIALALLIAILSAMRDASVYLVAPLAAMVIPILTWRVDMRPEAFTYVLALIFYAVLNEWDRGRLRSFWLFALSPLMALWVNLHIGFIFGFVVLGAFCLKKIFQGNLASSRPLFLVTGLSIVAGLLNPSFARGLIYPVLIYRDAAYPIIENQSILNPPGGAGWDSQIFLFKLLLAVTVSVFLLRLLTRTAQSPRFWAEMLLVGSVGVLATWGVRHFLMFSLFAVAILPVLVADVLKELKVFHAAWIRYTGLALTGVALLACWEQYTMKSATAGLGLKQGSTATEEFLQTNHVSGPILNDFNNGSFLLFTRFPASGATDGDRVFVDARPEAYSREFFAELKGLQQDETSWRAADNRYHFNAIVFSLQYNNSPETERFLIARVHDPEWAPVFTDQYSLVYLRRTPQNMETIRAHELPASMFR